MRRRLFNIAAGVSLVLFLAFSALWALSGAGVPVNLSVGRLSEGQLLFSASVGGYGVLPRLRDRLNIQWHCSDDETGTEARGRVWPGFWWSLARDSDGKAFRDIEIWLGYVLIVTAICPATWVFLWWRRSRRSRPGHCSSCGYDLRASTGECPECGAAIEVDGAGEGAR